jgi:hypothetical protein
LLELLFPDRQIHQILSQLKEFALGEYAVKIEGKQIREVFCLAPIFQHLGYFVQEEVYVHFGKFLQARWDRSRSWLNYGLNSLLRPALPQLFSLGSLSVG